MKNSAMSMIGRVDTIITSLRRNGESPKEFKANPSNVYLASSMLSAAGVAAFRDPDPAA